ncbi:hypothetical protein V1525DRAFT_454892 [Lipomyces kononenkoae]|uniref:Uncharacterized protein n=1 Tax=Lipomyces kononenkoae TaxID=34357 RepID=A0ACC3T6N7_LIPKO
MRALATSNLVRQATARLPGTMMVKLALARHYADLTRPRPGPPRLPQEEQEEFERLLEKANKGAFAPPSSSTAPPDQQPESEALQTPASAKMTGASLAYAGRTIPEFEGDVNPKTGEIGGPKQDPLRHGDYSFNGRVTDF